MLALYLNSINFLYEQWGVSYSDGPSFLKGLPGLILRCETSDGTKMNLVSFKKIKQNSKMLNKLDFAFKNTTLKDFLKAKNAIKEQLNSGQTITTPNGQFSIKKTN